MGAPKIVLKTPPKEAFELVRSMNQKRKIYEEAIAEGHEFTVKIGEDMYSIVPSAIVGPSVVFAPIPGAKIQPLSDAIGFFYVGQDRYFFNATVGQTEKYLTMPLEAEVFKLQRRKTLRASVPDDYPIFFLVTHMQSKMVFLESLVADISGGGIRIYFPKGTPASLVAGTNLTGTIRTPNGKVIEFDGVVRHITQDPDVKDNKFFGVEMLNSNGVSQRMMALTLEVQRRIIANS